MTLTEQTRKYAIQSYVEPARQKGEHTIRIRVGTIQKELGWTNRTPSVFSTLSSQPFQREARIQLIEKRGGPASGGPSTTVEFVYRILDQETKNSNPPPTALPGAHLKALYGLCAETFKSLGGGETFLRELRGEEPDAWEHYEAELVSQGAEQKI